jgi:hypothetical protein
MRMFHSNSPLVRLIVLSILVILHINEVSAQNTRIDTRYYGADNYGANTAPTGIPTTSLYTEIFMCIQISVLTKAKPPLPLIH